jgi:hypothetical protein
MEMTKSQSHCYIRLHLFNSFNGHIWFRVGGTHKHKINDGVNIFSDRMLICVSVLATGVVGGVVGLGGRVTTHISIQQPCVAHSTKPQSS